MANDNLALTALVLPDTDIAFGSAYDIFAAAVTGRVDHLSLRLDRPLGSLGSQLDLTGAADFADGQTQQAITVPSDAVTGSYNVTQATVYDTSGGSRTYTTADLAAAGISTSLKVGNSKADTDSLRPNLDFLTLPNNIVSSADGTSTAILASGTDAGGSRLKQMVIELDHAIRTTGGDVSTLTLTPTSDGYADRLGTTLAVTGATGSGTYSIIRASLADTAGNTRTFSAADLAALSTYRVNTRFTIDDRTAPTLTAFSIPAVDVSNGSAAAQIKATVSDAGSNPASVTLSLDHPVYYSSSPGHGIRSYSPTSTLSLSYTYATVENGSTTVVGAYNAIDPVTKAGDYVVTKVVVADLAGNSTTYTTADLAALGFDTRLAVKADTVGPTLTKFTLPSNYDGAAGSFNYGAIRVGATDTGSTIGLVNAVVHFDRAIGIYGPDLGIYQAADASFSNMGYFQSGRTGVASVGGVPVPYGTYNVTGVTLSDYAGNKTDYTAAQLRDLGYATAFDVFNSNPLGARYTAKTAQDVLTAPTTGSSYFEGHDGGQVVLHGNVGDYVLSRVQPSTLSGASGDQVGAFLLTARNLSGAYAIEESIGTVQFANGQYLSLKDLAAYVEGSSSLQAGGSANDLLFQNGTPYQLFVGGEGHDSVYLYGNVKDYTLKSFDANTPTQSGGLSGSHYSGLELIATNGSGALLIDGSVETVHFRNGQYVSFGDLHSYVVADSGGKDQTLGIAFDGDVNQSLIFSGTGATDRVLLNGAPKDYSLSRDNVGNFVLSEQYTTGGVANTLTISQSAELVQFRSGQYLSLHDLDAYVSPNYPGSTAFTNGGSGNDILTTPFGGDQYVTGGAGLDDAYLHGNTHDYTIRHVDQDAAAYRPAIHGYELVATNGSGNIYLDGSIETIHFQNGQYLAFADLPAFVSDFHM